MCISCLPLLERETYFLELATTLTGRLGSIKSLQKRVLKDTGSCVQFKTVNVDYYFILPVILVASCNFTLRSFAVLVFCISF